MYLEYLLNVSLKSLAEFQAWLPCRCKLRPLTCLLTPEWEWRFYKNSILLYVYSIYSPTVTSVSVTLDGCLKSCMVFKFPGKNLKISVSIIFSSILLFLHTRIESYLDHKPALKQADQIKYVCPALYANYTIFHALCLLSKQIKQK